MALRAPFPPLLFPRSPPMSLARACFFFFSPSTFPPPPLASFHQAYDTRVLVYAGTDNPVEIDALPSMGDASLDGVTGLVGGSGGGGGEMVPSQNG